MEESLRSRLKHAWNVFRSKEAIDAQPFRNDPWSGYHTYNVGVGSAIRQDRVRLTPSTEKSFVAALYNQIAVDVAAIPIKHIKTDQNGRYIKTVDSGLNHCLSVEANIDQTGRELIQDAVISMCDEGAVAIVPVDTAINIKDSNAFDILTMRTGKIIEWYPDKVKVRVYNDQTGEPQDVVLPKQNVAIIQNPFFATMNEPNSTLKRLIHKLNLLDILDEQNSSNRFNMILQLPYTVKSDARKKQAAERLDDLEHQLAESKYGIAYIDGTEKITQLNRTIESDLLKQVEDLKSDLYSQMGISREVFDGTADEQKTLNYENSTLEPILSTICDEMIRKFLTKTARTQGQTIKYFKDPFRLIPINNIADIADKFTRNEILSSNELRSIIGREPVDDPRADELRNKNLNQSKFAEQGQVDPVSTEKTEE